MYLITSQDIDIDGFAGLRERHYVMDSRLFGDHRKAESAQGLGALVYLADAHFLRFGSTGRHSHRDIDIVTLVCNGRLLHRGTLGDESLFEAGDILIQRAGLEGFQHNEVNPDEKPNRIIQIWMMPEHSAQQASHDVMRCPATGRREVYRNSSTQLDVMTIKAGEAIHLPGNNCLYLVDGEGCAEQEGEIYALPDQSLLQGLDVRFNATTDVRMIVVTAL